MKILAIDLGDTTGWCFLDNEAMYDHGIGEMSPMVLEADIVVIERPAYVGPPTKQEEYSRRIADFRHVFGDRVKVVRPADWMPRFMHYPLPERGVLRTQHEKDAYRMARWAQEKFGS